MKHFIAMLGAVSAFALAGHASAAVMYTFDGGAPSPSAGYVVVDNFNTSLSNAFVTATGSGVIHAPGSDGTGAQPANSIPCCTPYLTVTGGGSETLTFAHPVEAVQFDWGSVDSYNTLTIDYTPASTIGVGGSVVAPPANGDQSAAATNVRFTVFGTGGSTITSITLTSTSNSFEIDNLSVAVPEPASWALMLL